MDKHKKGLVLNLSLSFVAVALVVWGLTAEIPNKVKEPKEEDVEEEQNRVYLEIVNGDSTLRYDEKLSEDSKLFDFLNTLREENKITYEKTSYSTGEIVESINGIANTPSSQWVLYINGEKQKPEAEGVVLTRNSVYRFVYEHKE